MCMLRLRNPKVVQRASGEKRLEEQWPSKLCKDVKNMNLCSGSLLSGVTAGYWFYACLQIIVPRAIEAWDLPGPRLREATAWWPLSAQEEPWQGFAEKDHPKSSQRGERRRAPPALLP